MQGHSMGCRMTNGKIHRSAVKGVGIFAVVAMIGILTCLASPSAAQEPASKKNGPSVRGAEAIPVVLQLRWFHQFQFAGYYAASEKGFYRARGLSVRIVEGGKNRNTVEEVNSGRADFGVGSSEILLHRLLGKPLVVLAVVFQHSPLVVISLKSSGIAGPHQLRGKRLMMKGGWGDASILVMLKNEGIDPAGFSMVNHVFHMRDLTAGTVDAVTGYVTNEPFLLAEAGVPVNIIDPRSYAVDFYGDNLFTSERRIGRSPETVRGFLAATLAGWEYAMAKPHEIVDLILEKYSQKKSRRELLNEAGAIRKLILPELVHIGHMNPHRWKRIADAFVELGAAGPSYNLSGFLFDSEDRKRSGRMGRLIRWFAALVTLLLLGGAGLIYLNRRLKRAVLISTAELRNEVAERKAMEKTLQGEKERARSYLDIAGVIIVVMDNAGRVVLINRKGTEILGYPPEEIQGRNWFDLVLPEEGGKEMRKYYEGLPGKEVSREKHLVTTILTRKKEKRVIEWNFISISDEKGIHAGVVGSGEDITLRLMAENALRESERRYRDIVELSPECILICAGKRIVFINDAGVKLFGGDSPSGIIGTFLDERAEGGLWEKILLSPENGNTVGRKTVSLMDEKLTRLDGSVLYGDVRAIPTRHYGRKAVQVIIHDTTARRNAEERIVELNRDLEKRVMDRTARLNRSLEKLRKTQKQLVETEKMASLGGLVVGVAHEINTPVGVGITMASFLEDRTRDYAELYAAGRITRSDFLNYLDTVGEGSKTILENLNRAADMIKNFKKVAVDRAGEPRMRFNLGKHVEGVVIAAKSEYKTLNHKIVVNIPDDIHVDSFPDCLAEIVRALLDNSVIHGFGFRDTGEIIIEAFTSGKNLVVIHSDDGEGMGDEEVGMIFEPFFTTKRGQGGIGLGMHIVYNMVTHVLMGRIKCESYKGRGTTFVIEMPLEPPALDSP